MTHLAPCGVCLTILIVCVCLLQLLLSSSSSSLIAIGSQHRFNRIHTLGYRVYVLCVGVGLVCEIVAMLSTPSLVLTYRWYR